MKTIVCTAILLISMAMAQGQNLSERRNVTQDEKVDVLLNTWRQENRTTGMTGFRVQIYSAAGNRSKLLTDREKASFDASYPGVRSYIIYDEPYFKLRVGDFRSRLEAEKFLREVSPKFNSSIIVTDRINLPRLNNPEGNN
jgi:hypothetical protein